MNKLLPKAIGLSLNTLAILAPGKAAQIGLALFCRPIRSAISKKQKAFFDTAEMESFSFKGKSVQTYRWGNGSKNILLLHGWQSHTYRWKLYIEALSKEYSVYAFDAPGHGLSEGKLLNVLLYGEVIGEQINRMGAVDTIIAHSLGGFATLYAFYNNPNLAANKIVTMASPGEATEFFSFFTGALGLSRRCALLIEDRFKQTFQRTPAFFSAPVFASGLTVPGLIIHDEEDRETSFEHAQRIHASWKNSRLVKTKGLGHNLKSPEVVKEVIQFVKEPLSNHFNSEIIHDNTKPLEVKHPNNSR